MNGIVQKVVCFFALLLVISIGSVAHAQQQSYYVYEHTYSESAKKGTCDKKLYSEEIIYQVC